MLPLRSPDAAFSRPPDPQRVLESMVGVALVEPDLASALHVGIQHSVDHEQRALEAADLVQDLAGRDVTGRHRRRDPEDVRPIGRDQVLPDRAARQTTQIRRSGLPLEDVEALGRQVADARE